MKYLIFILAAFLLCSFNDKGHHWYNSIYYSCKYETTEGRLNGKYKSFYYNGKKKAQGVFNNNYRSGIWSVWDENGNLILRRNYINPFAFTGLYPDAVKNHKSTYSLERDRMGCYKHFVFTEKIIKAAGRSTRFIEPLFNPLLFNNNRLYTVLQNLVLNNQVKAFPNDSLKSALNQGKIITNTPNIIGFKTLEDWILDSVRLTLEYYTIGICPVAVNSTSDTIDLYWLEMNDIRKYLVNEKVNSKDLPLTVRNLDDLFFLHCFQSTITKTYMFNDNTHPLSKPDPINKLLRIDLDIIDNEHDLWVYLLNKSK